MRRLHLAAFGLLVGVLVLWLAGMAFVLNAALLPDEASGKVLAVFSPWQAEEQSFAAIIEAGARPVRPVASFIWVVQSDDAGLARRLREQGAHAVYGEFRFGPALAGCLAYIGGKGAQPPSVL